MRKSFITFLAATVLLSLVGCGSGETTPTNTQGESSETIATKEEPKEQASKPEKGGKKITYWVSMNPNAAPVVATYNEVEFFKQVKEETGVEVEFLHPPTGQGGEQFKLLIASRNDLPDVMETTWLTAYPGGPEKAIKDGIIIDIAPYLEANGPNYKNMIESDPELLKQSKTDSGAVYGFHAVNGSDKRLFGGFMMRQDWLEELGLAVPETIGEWEAVLTAFKEQKGAPMPLSVSMSSLIDHMIPAYGITQKFYLEGDQVQYGAIQPEYKEFLTTMNRWYENGLIDSDFASIDSKTIDSNVLNDKTGATFGGLGGGMGKWLDASTNPNFDLVATPFPTLEKGQRLEVLPASYSHKMRGTTAAVTTAAEDVETIVSWFDQRYSDEGVMMRNFGREGLTYNMVDGQPVYTDLITQNPEGLSMAVALAQYTQAGYPSPGVCEHPAYHSQYMYRPAQQAGLEMFNRDVETASKNMLPPVVATPDESKELATIVTEMDTYISEKTIGFITGVESLDKFEEFVEQVKVLGVERAVAIQQAGVDRYNNR
ncbi:MAG: extracellular solute-binding protein [Cellulosilyticaceae bacterium]